MSKKKFFIELNRVMGQKRVNNFRENITFRHLPKTNRFQIYLEIDEPRRDFDETIVTTVDAFVLVVYQNVGGWFKIGTFNA